MIPRQLKNIYKVFKKKSSIQQGKTHNVWHPTTGDQTCQEQENMTQHEENNQSVDQNGLRPTQVLDVADKDTRVVIRTVFCMLTS